MQAGNRRSDLPRFELDDVAQTEIECLRGLQRLLLTHPVACQAAFSALVAEGRRFSASAEGRDWQDKLSESDLLQQVRLVFDLTTLGMLDEAAGAGLPSSYLDALFMIGAGGDADRVLNQLFWGHDTRGRS